MKQEDVNNALGEIEAVTSQRGQDYSDGYLRHIKILDALFPAGAPSGPNFPLRVKLRFFFVFNIVGKLVRFCDNIHKEEGHPDSRLDLAGYSTLLLAADKPEADKK